MGPRAPSGGGGGGGSGGEGDGGEGDNQLLSLHNSLSPSLQFEDVQSMGMLLQSSKEKETKLTPL